MTRLPESFRHCPRCAAERPREPAFSPFRCGRCGFVLYLNTAGAVAALVVDSNGQLLFTRRAKDPGRGRLGWPGGFVDAGESAEEALRREAYEEVGLELGDLQYLCSAPNTYPFADVVYQTVDLFYVARGADPARVTARDAVSSVSWRRPAELDPSELAFESFRVALAAYRRRESVDGGR